MRRSLGLGIQADELSKRGSLGEDFDDLNIQSRECQFPESHTLHYMPDSKEEKQSDQD